MSANPRWCSAISIALGLTFFFAVFAKASAEDQQEKTWRPFQTQEELNRIIDDLDKMIREIWKPFLSEEDLRKLILDEITIIKQELKKTGATRFIDRSKIQRAALLISVAALNWKEPKNPRQPLAVSYAAALLAKPVLLAKEGSWKDLEQSADRLANFKGIDERDLYRDWTKTNWERLIQSADAFSKEQFTASMMKIFSRDLDPRRKRTERELLGLDSWPRALKGEEMSEKIRLMAFMSALIARVTKSSPTLVGDKSYLKWADDMDEASLELAAAVKAKKEVDANKALLKLTRSCISCHEALLGRPNVQELIGSLKSKESEDRQKAADRLADYGFAADKPEYRAIMPRENGSVDYFRRRLKPATLPLIETLKDKDQWVRISAVNALEKMGLKPETPLPSLNNALHDSDDFVRFWFAYASRSIEDKPENAVRVLVKALKDRDSDVRSAAAEALGRLRADAADSLPALKEALDDQDPDVRESAIKALRQRDGESAMPVFLKALQDTDPIVRANAATALARIGVPAVPELTKMLKDQNRDARGAAAYALGRIGPKAEMAVADLKEMLKEEDEYLRKAAGEALGKITAKPKLPP